MPTATFTSKGQMTIPKKLRDRFNLRLGDRVEVQVVDDRIVLIPPSGGIADLASILPRPEKSVSLAAMREAIRTRANLRSR